MIDEGSMGKLLTPNEPAFVHEDHRSTSYNIAIPDSRSELQIMRSLHPTDLQDNLVSPFHICKKQGLTWTCEPLPVGKRKLLPPSPARPAEFPRPGRGVRADEGLVYMTVDIPQGNAGRRIIVEVEGPVSAVVALVGDSDDSQSEDIFARRGIIDADILPSF